MREHFIKGSEGVGGWFKQKPWGLLNVISRNSRGVNLDIVYWGCFRMLMVGNFLIIDSMTIIANDGQSV